jgi:hypothetical protein
MNGYESDEGIESVAELLEDIESDESDEAEASRSNRFRRLPAVRPKLPSGQGLFRQRPSSQNVTQVQLQAALTRVGAQIKTNADATKTVGTRVNTVNNRVDAEIAARKKETGAIKKELSSGKMMGILPLLLTKPPKLTKITVDPTSHAVTSQEYEKQDNLLPLVLLMGMGGMGGGEGQSENNMMPLLMVLMLSK